MSDIITTLLGLSMGDQKKTHPDLESLFKEKEFLDQFVSWLNIVEHHYEITWLLDTF